ncbi:MAG: prepilin-type N-terminal cleavage/methylation domain-containing protein [Patescibacteria group bacterium]
MLLSQLHPKKGFTLIEMMIVIAIIMMLLGLVLFPYSYYMQRAYVENTGDTIAQGWILAHKDVRNGKLFDIGTTANKLLIFRKGSREVEQYLLSGSVIPELTLIENNPDIRREKSILSDSDVQIL